MSKRKLLTLRERVKHPERCQHGYLLTWKYCPMCKQNGVVMNHGTKRRAIYTALLVAYSEAGDGCQECGRTDLDLLKATDAVLESLSVSVTHPGAQAIDDD